MSLLEVTFSQRVASRSVTIDCIKHGRSLCLTKALIQFKCLSFIQVHPGTVDTKEEISFFAAAAGSKHVSFSCKVGQYNIGVYGD